MKLQHLFEDSFAKEHNLTNVSTGVGYSEKEKKWYGWSHRAYCAFGIGDKIFDPDFGDDSTPYKKHGEKTIKTDADAKKAAVAFADYVG